MSAKIGLGIISFAHGYAGVYCRRLLTYDDVHLVAGWDDNDHCCRWLRLGRDGAGRLPVSPNRAQDHFSLMMTDQQTLE